MKNINLKQNDIVALDIVDYGINGEGIAKRDGIVIFVPFAMKGERVKAKITFVKKNFATAKLLEILLPSSHRIESPCNRFGRCGGCNLLHIKYEEQLNLKRELLKTTLRKNTGNDYEVGDCAPSDKKYAYRNKVQLPFGTVNNKVAVGFFEENSHKIASITKCFLHESWLEKLIKIVLEFSNRNYLSAYDEKTGKGLLRHLVARYIDDQLCVVIVTNGNSIPKSQELVQLLDEQFKSFSLYLSVNEENTNVIMGKTLIPIKEKDFVINVLGINLKVHPLSFLQVNNFVRDEIYKKVIDYVRGSDIVIDAYSGLGIIGAVLAKNGTKKAYNIEIVPEAVQDANQLAKDNNIIEQVENLCGDAAILLPKLMNNLAITQLANGSNFAEQVQDVHGKTSMASPDATRNLDNADMDTQSVFENNPDSTLSIILDPPRKGIDDALASNTEKDAISIILDSPRKGIDDALASNTEKAAISIILDPPRKGIDDALASNTEKDAISIILDPPRKGIDKALVDALNNINVPIKLVYISCNPATLSRDISLLTINGNYNIISITPYDMFPQTKHVETLCCLSKKV